MKIARFTSALLLAALVGSAQAGPTLLSEGFDDVGTLAASGWVYQALSGPVALPNAGWFQGDNTSEFTAQSGPDSSYIASNFLASSPTGFIDTLLITPFFSLESDVTLTFWARTDNLGFSDSFAVLAGTTVGAGGEAVSQVLADTVAVGDWTQYTVQLAGQGAGATGRFAFEYFGSVDTSNYIGFDTVTVTAVPEPETYALMGLGLAALALRRRKSAA